jgi:hypothetical protein
MHYRSCVTWLRVIDQQQHNTEGYVVSYQHPILYIITIFLDRPLTAYSMNLEYKSHPETTDLSHW